MGNSDFLTDVKDLPFIAVKHHLYWKTPGARHKDKWEFGRTLTLINLGTRRRLSGRLHAPAALPRGKGPRYPAGSWEDLRVGHGPFRKGTNILTLPGMEPRFVGRTARSNYTKWAISASVWIVLWKIMRIWGTFDFPSDYRYSNRRNLWSPVGYQPVMKISACSPYRTHVVVRLITLSPLLLLF